MASLQSFCEDHGDAAQCVLVKLPIASLASLAATCRSLRAKVHKIRQAWCSLTDGSLTAARAADLKPAASLLGSAGQDPVPSRRAPCAQGCQRAAVPAQAAQSAPQHRTQPAYCAAPRMSPRCTSALLLGAAAAPPHSQLR